ncbi:MAG: hypothetical protein IJ663_05670 [Spirochaetales bacterium]|nr:hypothetical protein [Spirochaetales bacterium]
MKHIVLLLALLILILPCAFADTMDFSIKWILDNTEVTTLEVLDYYGGDTLNKVDGYVDAEITITPTTSTQYNHVCQVRYTTNKRGLSYIDFTATPMTETASPQTLQFGYRLVMAYNGAEYVLDVISGGDNTKRVPFDLVSVGSYTFIIQVDAVLTELGSMPINPDGTSKEYQSVITIARYTE